MFRLMTANVSVLARRAVALAASLCVIAAGAGFGGATRADAANPTVCGMLSAAEMRGWWGTDMRVSKEPGIVDCQWVPANGSDASLTVQIVSASAYVEPKLGHGFRKLTGIANRAYVVNDLGGWSAGALKGAKAVVIRGGGGKTTRDTIVTILKTLVKKV